MKTILTILLAHCAMSIVAQNISSQVISSLGGEYANEGARISYTMGELSTVFYLNSSSSLSEGFHQSYSDVISGIEDLPSINHFNMYPNPTLDILNLEFDGELKKLQGQLYNSVGQKMMDIKIDQFTQIDMSILQSGTYFLKITDSKNKSETISIIKS